MYCINCGVKLADTEKICPLCGVTVFHPEISRPEGEPLYPRGRYPAAQVNSRIAAIILSTLFALPLFICLLCDLCLKFILTNLDSLLCKFLLFTSFGNIRFNTSLIDNLQLFLLLNSICRI